MCREALEGPTTADVLHADRDDNAVARLPRPELAAESAGREARSAVGVRLSLRERYREIRQYDYENRLHDLALARPGKIDLRIFADTDAVRAYLADPSPHAQSRIGVTTELIVDTLEIEEADLFGFSCSALSQPDLADSLAVAHQSLCIATMLKQRFPDCTTVIGGIQVGTTEAYRIRMLGELHAQCAALDYSVDGHGEAPLLHLVEHLTGKRTFEENHQRFEEVEGGAILLRNVSVRPSTFLEDADGPVVLDMATPEDETAGDDDGGVDMALTFSPPHYDWRTLGLRRRSGRETLCRYGVPLTEVDRLAGHHGDPVLVVPMIFVLGCNARCAFCPYSEQGMSFRDIDYVIRSIAWLQERHQTRYFHFLNTNVNAQKKYAHALADALIDAKLDILWSDSLNLRSLDEPLLEKLRESGLIRLVTGIECPSDRMLKLVNKGMTVKRAAELLHAAHSLGIWTHNQFIAGMPTEGEADRQAFVEFIEATKEVTNGYSVSPFYLDMNSLMWTDPEKYGVRVINDPEGLQEAVAFDEIDGLKWPEKRPQIGRTVTFLSDEITRIKGSRRYVHPSLDLDLLFFLYDVLGHDDKAEIVRLSEAAMPGNPAEARQAPVGVEDWHAVQAAWAEVTQDRVRLDEQRSEFQDRRDELEAGHKVLEEQRAQLEAVKERVERLLSQAEATSATDPVSDDESAAFDENEYWQSDLGETVAAVLGRQGQQVPALRAFRIVGLVALGPEEFLVSFHDDAADEFDLLLCPMTPTARCYTSTKRFAVSYPSGTNLDSPAKQEAVRAFQAFLATNEA